MSQRMPLALFAPSAVLSHFLVPLQRRSNMAPRGQGCGRGTIHPEACELQQGAPAKYGMLNPGSFESESHGRHGEGDNVALEVVDESSAAPQAASAAAGAVVESPPLERYPSQASTTSSRRMITRKAWQFGVDGKEFHYFLSHKKEHTKHGSVPGHVALNLHDSLQLLGFRGWCDVDNLHEISKDGLRAGIEACCTTIVLINDETHLSEWCTFEWETARELEIPIRVVVDLERGSKAQCLQNAASFKNLMRFQWLELAPKMRREMLGDLVTFLHEYASANPEWALPSSLQEDSEQSLSARKKYNKKSAQKRMSFRNAVLAASVSAAEEQGSVKGSFKSPESGEELTLTIERNQFVLGTLEDGTPMWYPGINVLMLCGGLDLTPHLHGLGGRLWHAVVFSAR